MVVPWLRMSGAEESRSGEESGKCRAEAEGRDAVESVEAEEVEWRGEDVEQESRRQSSMRTVKLDCPGGGSACLSGPCNCLAGSGAWQAGA